MLDHLRRRDVGDQLGAAEGAVQRGDALAHRGLVRAHDDAVGAQEVARSRCPRAGTPGSRRRPRRAGRARRARAAGARRCPAAPSTSSPARRRLVPAGMASSTASTRLRSASPDALGGVSTQTKAMSARSNSSAADDVNVSRSREPASSSSHARLVDRRLARAQPRELRLVDVEADDVVARLREARGRHETDVAHADHAEPLTASCCSPGVEDQAAGARRAGPRLFAIAIIVSGDSLSSSELSIQTTTPPAALHALAAVEDGDAVDRRAVRCRRDLAAFVPADLPRRLLEDRRVRPGRVAQPPGVRGIVRRAPVDGQRLAVLAEAYRRGTRCRRLDGLAVGGAERHLRRVQQLVADLLLVARRSCRGRTPTRPARAGARGGGAACLAHLLGGGVTPENALPIATTTSASRPKSLIDAGRSTDAFVSPSERRSCSAERRARAARVVDGGREQVRLRAGCQPRSCAASRPSGARPWRCVATPCTPEPLTVTTRSLAGGIGFGPVSSSWPAPWRRPRRAAEAARDGLRDGRVRVLELGHGLLDRLAATTVTTEAPFDHPGVSPDRRTCTMLPRGISRQQLDVAQDRLRADRLALGRAAHLEVVGQRVEQAEEVRARRPDVEAALELAHERLLARGAHEVGVEVPVAHVLQRLRSRRASGSRAAGRSRRSCPTLLLAW